MLKRRVLELLTATEDGSVIEEEAADIIPRIPGGVNAALILLATAGQYVKKQCVLTPEQAEESDFRGEVLFDMAALCESFHKVLLVEVQAGQGRKKIPHRTLGDKLIIGKLHQAPYYVLTYAAYCAPVTDETTDEEKFELSPEAAEVLPEYVCAYIGKDDQPEKVQQWTYGWQEKFSLLRDKNQCSPVRVRNGFYYV
jgi:hypothetical protein